MTTPVLVGVGSASQRCDDPREAAEPLELMQRALDAAAGEVPGFRDHLDRIAVPHGRWSYGDPGRLLAPRATSVLAEVGVLQHTLIADAAELIARGEIGAAAVVGGEAGHRLARAARAGIEVADTPHDGKPDVHLAAADELIHPVEKRAGLNRAANAYAVLESAFAHRHGLTPAQTRDRIAALYARFSEVAAANPDAWRPKPVDAASIREPSEKNPMLAFPYTRAHVSSWSVDQAGALLLCSTEVADELGVPPGQRVYPVVDAESNAMVAVSARDELGDSPGARAVSRAVLEHAGIGPVDLDLVDLYSCFPVAVEMFAEALGLRDDRDLTVTGGMNRGGGPFNNYVLQATVTLARQLRARGGFGLVSGVSGLMTKQAATIWSSAEPARPYSRRDVSPDLVAREVVDDHTGPATVVGHTVLHIPKRPIRAVAVLDLPDGRRTVARNESPEITAGMAAEDWCGRRVEVSRGEFRPSG
ncbi:hypothetical protein [Actinomycetospora chibensis]|uniref:Acetyl-CoA C-acetyltransferase n=1 Tax=Actinomycetospora chibensis TaxID=663606 RepID=A0ABV9RLL1_9PSEU|nr:hypothetical protein [Actinomycetospora chibensis]MDD7927634.1 hypothetical protein [Actinomycetospora chibensis]